MSESILELAYRIIAGEPLPLDTPDEDIFDAIQLAIRINCPTCGE